MSKDAETARLITTPNIADPDGFYAELIESQSQLSDGQANRMNARLVLLLANHVGRHEILSEAIKLARGDPYSN
jgi:hypothetical protein